MEADEARLPVIFLMGPTAAGKTDLAVALAGQYPVGLINVDSALVYRGLNIGAARPDARTLEQAPHRLMAIRDVTEPYSAADFREDALTAIADIHASKRIPVLVGGTMMYFKALMGGLAALPQADAALRAQIEAQAAAKGWPAIHARLALVDPDTATRLSPNDSQRLQRALEVFELTGIPLSAHHRQQQSNVQLLDSRIREAVDFPYNVRAFAVAPRQRQLLHQRIEKRLLRMFDDGLVDEVRHFFERGDVTPDMPAMRAVGYRQVWEYLSGQHDYDTMVYRALVATRQLAKRQLTWLRSWPDVTWLYCDSKDELLTGCLAHMGVTVCQMAEQMD